MPLTAAERQRRYRERLKELNPTKYEELRIKNLNRIKSKYVPISKLTETRKNMQRKNWRRLKSNQKKDSEQKEKTSKSRKAYLKNYYNLKKKILKQKKQIEKQKKVIAALRKKVYRQKLFIEVTKNDVEPFVVEARSPTPDKVEVQKIFQQNHMLTAAIKRYYAKSRNSIRRIMKKIFLDISSHYKMRSKMGYCLGLKGKLRFVKKLKKKCRKDAKKVRHFFLQDDVSRATAGRKDTKTLKKKKMQKRYLLDTLKNLHKKFMNDTGIKICYASFIKNRPFYVVKPRLADRDTCVCKIHANMEFLFLALKKEKILKYEKFNDFIEDVVCDKRSKECMYSECEQCKMLSIPYSFVEKKEDEDISWLEWKSKKVKINKKEGTKEVKKVVTEMRSGKVKDLIVLFESELKKIKLHMFNVSHQYKIMKNLKEQLESNEVILICDFSENYGCKMHKEVQAVHFSYQNQITLHTSVVYVKQQKPQGYCTLSDSTNHAPEAIWAHLKPVLVDIKQNYPEIDTLHVFSDGPSTQYKQKKNFYLFKHLLGDLGFEKGTWNYSEAYHGKGAADGIGGSIKRSLDMKVSQGNDVLNSATAYALLENETTIKLFCVDDTDINNIKVGNEPALNTLSAVPNTQKIHQIKVYNTDSHNIFYRNLSCFCNTSGKRGFCRCFSTEKHCLLQARSRKRSRQILSSDSDNTFDLPIHGQRHIFVRKNTIRLRPAAENFSSTVGNSSEIDKVVSISPKPVHTSQSRFIPAKTTYTVNQTLLPVAVPTTSSRMSRQISDSSDSEMIFDLPIEQIREKTICLKPVDDKLTPIFEKSSTAAKVKTGPEIPTESTSILKITQPLRRVSGVDSILLNPISQKDNLNTGTKQRPSNIVETKKRAPVTILSDIKVDYSREKLNQIMKNSTKRYNVSSYDIRKDFPEQLASKSGVNFFDSDSDDN